jgi:hypothetical protein
MQLASLSRPRSRQDEVDRRLDQRLGDSLAQDERAVQDRRHHELDDQRGVGVAWQVAPRDRLLDDVARQRVAAAAQLAGERRADRAVERDDRVRDRALPRRRDRARLAAQDRDEVGGEVAGRDERCVALARRDDRRDDELGLGLPAPVDRGLVDARRPRAGRGGVAVRRSPRGPCRPL